jgi:GPN-loop GTPase
MDDFFIAVDGAREEYDREYKPELDRLRKEKQERDAQKKKSELEKLMNDMNVADKKRDDSDDIESDSEQCE